MLKAKLLGATAGAEASLAIEDVFSTYLYKGNGSTQTITNGIDLAGEGGLVWIKWRSGGGLGSSDNALFDTARGVNNILYSNSTMEQQNTGTGSNASLSAFNSDGFSLGADAMYGRVNYLNGVFASWTFRKAPRFFDVVTYTGTSSTRTVDHSLGVEPGMIIFKNTTDGGTSWIVWHKDLGGNDKGLKLENDTSVITNANYFANTAPTSTNFTVGTHNWTNGAGDQIVAYLYAHDSLGPSGDGSDGLIACGSYTGNGSSSGPRIELGWEPQWILYKAASTTGDWGIHDNMRGLGVGDSTSATGNRLEPNTSDAETGASNFANIDATGFTIKAAVSDINGSGQTYIYIAIRRGPMREPESGTEVFAAFADTTDSPRTLTTGWPVDFGIQGYRTLGWDGNTSSRLQGGNYLRTRTTSEEFTGFQYFNWDSNTALISNDGNTSSKIIWAMRRAPGFFDVVAYTGTGSAITIPHNLAVKPELIIQKRRNAEDSWYVFTKQNGFAELNSSGAFAGLGNGSGTDTIWQANASTIALTASFAPALAASGSTNIAYLFATLAGISKVGSYTGNGSSQTINCDFTTGARFILIKRTDSTGDWYVWDTARGIVSGNDPHLSLNTTAAEVTSDDSIDPDSTGFIVNQVAATNVNVNAATYIYLAIA
jgi:hypothetical protein